MDDYLFSYAEASQTRVRRSLIRLVEKATGQPKLKRLYVENQRAPVAGESFWQAAVRKLALDVRFDVDRLAAIPKTGPVVVVANHPYGVLDGIVLSWLVSRVRSDFVVLTHAVLLRAPEVRDFVLPVDFSGTRAAQEINLASRGAARAQLERGGVVVVFPAGAVSTAPDRLGREPAVDGPWQPFVAQLIQRAKATVVPIWFGGQNGRLFQIASHISLSLRLSLIFHEVKARIGASLPVGIGAPIAFGEIETIRDRDALSTHLRKCVYALAAEAPRVERPRGPAKFMAPVRAALRLPRAA